VSLDNLSNDELRELLRRFAGNFNEIRMVLRSIGDAAGTVAEAIDETLATFTELETRSEQDGQPPQRVAEDLTMLLREHLTSFTTVTGRRPVEVALTTEYREHLHAATEEAAGRKINPDSLDHFWGVPVVIDDSIPAQPGFEIR
jgi:hypothetical protein